MPVKQLESQQKKLSKAQGSPRSRNKCISVCEIKPSRNLPSENLPHAQLLGRPAQVQYQKISKQAQNDWETVKKKSMSLFFLVILVENPRYLS